MAKEKAPAEEKVKEPLEEKEKAQPIQDAGTGIDIKRLVMFAIIAWLAVAGAFIVVFRGNRNPEGRLEAAEQSTAPSPDISKQSEANANAQPSKKDAADSGSQSAAAASSEPLIVSFESIITNISGTNGRRFLKARINLEVANTEVEGKVRGRMVQLRDRLISLLSAKTIDELDGWERQDVIRREIRDEFNILLHSEGSEGVKQIYFTEFVIQ
ncbi:MAG TPA: flagellar basal body-associated FliL family protein [Candidatus Brocadiales bacterium]|nr:flagellar basal body-associated FliL family protein [Candidatus Brocadiales bacterium]